MNCRGRLMLAGLCFGSAAFAHEAGEPNHHARRGADAISADRPYRLADGRLYVSKPVQHLLGLRTQVYRGTATEHSELLGEVMATSQSRGVISAPQPGRLEPRAMRWPLAGQMVKSGEVLAVLRPQMTDRDRAQRRAALATIQQKLELARVNANRMRLQAQGAGDLVVRDNIYLEQAEAELATQERQFALASETLDGAVLLRAGTDGVLSAVNVKAGDLVGSGASLFEIASAAHTRVAITVFDPGMATRVRSAMLRLPSEQALPLKLVAQEPDSRAGWRLVFEATGPAPRPIEIGRLLPVELELATAECKASAERIWVHLEPEIFESRSAGTCATALRPGDRAVVQGGAVLEEYR